MSAPTRPSWSSGRRARGFPGIPTGFEAGCERPGLWSIEGYWVERVGRWWEVRDRPPFDGLLGKVATLAEACDVIDDHRVNA